MIREPAFASNRPRFNQYACCKKCGASSHCIGIKHTTLACGLGEVIRRTCGRCGFTWDEEPLDA